MFVIGLRGWGGGGLGFVVRGGWEWGGSGGGERGSGVGWRGVAEWAGVGTGILMFCLPSSFDH